MSYTHYERLSALDASFLHLEDENCHMHIGAVALFAAAPLATTDGGIDIERVRTAIAAGIHRIPRYRQRLKWIPGAGHPVWVDDARFNLNYHVRHTHLPRPGDERLLKRLAGRIMSQQLDRGKPLWEMWIVEGVADDRFAVITKIHHCMIDGIGSVELTGTVMRPTPDRDPRLEEPPPQWLPRPAPSSARLVADELCHRALLPLALLDGVRRVVIAPRRTANQLYDAVEGIGEALTAGMRPASATPLNAPIGPHRRFDWLEMDLGAVKEVKSRLGGTVNDVVLAIVAGALRRFLRQRGLQVEQLEFRAMLPVNVRTHDGRASLGNRVAMMVGRLPLEEPNARRRLERVIHETQELKRSRQAAGVQTIEEVSDNSFTTLFTVFSRLAALVRPFNVVVTNVPGPPTPAYILGAPMVACYPLVPLFRDQALGIALFSYAGRLYWGFNADWDLVPDLHDLVAFAETEFAALREVAARLPESAPSSSADGAAHAPEAR
jgi:diacylglycerol O-acyltransferase